MTKDRLRLYAKLMRLDRPIGIFLLLWPTLWALWVAAAGVPDALVLFVFISGVILMRSAGCVINDYADRNLDPLVARTKDRPLSAGQVSKLEAMVLFTILCAAAFGLVLLMNWFTIWLSFAGLALAIIYPFMKRYTYLPQVVLGAAFGWAVPMAFAAQSEQLPQEAWLLFIATVVWATAYDTMYAMVDREDDIKAGIKSTAILFGQADYLVIALLQCILLTILVLTGIKLEAGWLYYAGIALATCTFIYQYTLLKSRQTAKYFKAFLNNNWSGAMIFLGIFLEYLIR